MSTEVNSSSQDNRLGVIKTLIGAFLIPWSYRRELSKDLSVLFFLILILSVFEGYASGWYSSTSQVLLLFSKYFLYALFAVICHRVILLGTDSVRFSFIPRVEWRELRYFGYFLAIVLVSVVIVFVTAWVAMSFGPWSFSGEDAIQNQEMSEFLLHLGAFVIFAPALYVFSRLSLVLPATAIDHKPSLKWSWKVSKGNGWRLFVTVGTLPWFLAIFVSYFHRERATDLEYILLIAVSVLVVVFEVAALSLSYKDLVEGDLSRDKIVIEI